jgi:hypothetical protein
MKDTVEQAQEDRSLNSFDYFPDVFRTYYTTPYQQYKDKVGMKFEVLGHDVEAENDLEDFEEMYRIRLEDGSEITAWGHEVCVLDYKDCS